MACCSPCPEQATPTNSHKNRHRPPKENWTTVKLFITSYNDDFFCEREVLRKQVLPDLKAWCETKKVRLQECSIKWGARHPDKRDMQELEKVQTSIENCYYNNVMPLFINISSDSVGWLPMWGEYEDEMIEDYLEAYGLLTEDLEVMYGAYRDDNHNSIFVMRSDAFIESIPDTEKSHFVHRARASERIQEVGYKILKKFPPDRFLQYSCRYKGLDFKKKRPKVELDDCFRKKILDFCKERIAIDYCGESPFVSNNPYTFTKQSQNSFLRRKSSMVIGREDIVERIETYITQEEKDVPLLLLGGPGSGKSSILCKAADVVIGKAQHRQLPGSVGGQWHVFYHFVGAVPGSTTLEPMLKRLLSEMEVTSESSMPKNLESAAQMVCSLLSNPNTKPLIMFVDALNQFAEDQAALVMSWLPRKLAPQVRCVFSLINDTPQHVTLMGRETKPIELQVTPLDMISRKGIIEEMLGRYRKSLSANQTARLLDKESSENPLWLSVACEEIRLIESPPLIDSTIDNLADGLLNLLEQVLSRFEADRGGHLVVATLCLLESSNAGLLESELRQILGNEATLMPPSPFDEKEEKETSEKESVRQSSFLSEAKWNRVFSTLQPFLRPFGESTEGRLDFYHRALSKAVRKKYFQTSEAAEVESSGCDDAYYWWHKKLADYFETVDNVERRVEEHPYHLVCLEDKYRLANCLVNWDVFDKLYKEEFSSQLLIYWRKVGSSSEMVDQYKIALSALEEAGSANEELLSIRYEKVCRVVIQSGKYLEALELLKTAMKIEERELGARPYRMVELFALMAEIYDEKLKLNDFVSPSQLPDLRKTIMYGKKSITLRKQFTGNYHRFKLAMSLMKLAFSLESWEACGGTPEMTGDEALAEGNKYIDMALKIFKELNDMGHYAEALMTKGVLAPRGSMEQLKYYNQAMDLCMQIYGEYHILTSRLYINIGIVYEDNGDYKKAYEYFKKWARVSEEILGPEHPKTLRAKGVLKELRYRQIAQQLGEWDYEAHGQHNNNNNTSNDDDEEEVDNEEIIDYYDDIVRTWNVLHLNADNNPHSQLNNQEVSENNPTPPISQINALNISNDSQGHIEVTLNESNGSNLSGGVVDSNVENNDREDTSSSDDDSDINDHGALMNGYYDEDRDNVETEDNPEENEFEDNDLSYDDNFEDYDEQYILHLDTEPVIDEFNVQGLDYGDEDCEIIEMAARDTMYHQNDNRYASDGD